jgi:Family of unknown function (DUF6356)
MKQITAAFTRHPASLGESYAAHFGVAARFGVIMVWGGLKTLLHAIVPAWCETSGSDTIRALHLAMVNKRADRRQAHDDWASLEWVI